MAKVSPVHPRRKTNPIPSKKELAKIRTQVRAGVAVVKLAADLNYNPAELSKALREKMGMELKRGPKGPRSASTSVQA